MKKVNRLILALILIGCSQLLAQVKSDPWEPDQLESPAALALTIQSGSTDIPLVLSVGPAALIKGSIEVGPAGKKENLEKLKALLEKQPKDKQIVIYCGCCPFVHCPNIRPAFNLLKEMKFTNAKLLNLSTNIKTDWIDKGYPTVN